MRNFMKITAIYTIFYAIISFILLMAIGVFTVASRGAFMFTLFGGLPFFVGFLHIVGFICEIICLRLNKEYPVKRRLVLLCLAFYIVEILALVLPIVGMFGNASSVFAQNVILYAMGSIPVTKICLLVLSIIILVKFRKKRVGDFELEEGDFLEEDEK